MRRIANAARLWKTAIGRLSSACLTELRQVYGGLCLDSFLDGLMVGSASAHDPYSEEAVAAALAERHYVSFYCFAELSLKKLGVRIRDRCLDFSGVDRGWSRDVVPLNAKLYRRPLWLKERCSLRFGEGCYEVLRKFGCDVCWPDGSSFTVLCETAAAEDRVQELAEHLGCAIGCKKRINGSNGLPVTLASISPERPLSCIQPFGGFRSKCALCSDAAEFPSPLCEKCYRQATSAGVLSVQSCELYVIRRLSSVNPWSVVRCRSVGCLDAAAKQHNLAALARLDEIESGTM